MFWYNSTNNFDELSPTFLPSLRWYIQHATPPPWGNSHGGLYGKALPERGAFFKLAVS